MAIPGAGAINANARLHTVSGKHRFDKLRIQNQAGAPVQVSVAGSVGDVILFPQAALKSIQLKVEAKSTDSARLNTVFGLKDKIPLSARSRPVRELPAVTVTSWSRMSRSLRTKKHCSRHCRWSPG